MNITIHYAITMPFSEENKVLIKNLYQLKGYSWRRLIAEFPQKNWTGGGLKVLLRRVRDTGSTKRKQGSGKPRSARTEENVKAVGELVLSQENKPQTHKSTRQIARSDTIVRCSNNTH